MLQKPLIDSKPSVVTSGTVTCSCGCGLKFGLHYVHISLQYQVKATEKKPSVLQKQSSSRMVASLGDHISERASWRPELLCLRRAAGRMTHAAIDEDLSVKLHCKTHRKSFSILTPHSQTGLTSILPVKSYKTLIFTYILFTIQNNSSSYYRTTQMQLRELCCNQKHPK